MPGTIFPFASHFLWGPFHSCVGEVSQPGNSLGDEGGRESEAEVGKESQSKREGEREAERERETEREQERQKRKAGLIASGMVLLMTETGSLT